MNSLAKASIAFMALVTVNVLVSCGPNSDKSQSEPVAQSNQDYANSLTKLPPLANAHVQLTNADKQNSLFCQHRTIFLPETNDASSQFAIAQFIEKHAELAVFSERVSKTVTYGDLSLADQAAAAKMLATDFPNGLPATFAETTDPQKLDLSTAGADYFELVKKSTPMIHSIKAVIDRGTFTAEQARSAGEISALQAVNGFFQNHPEQRDVILIYAQSRNFSAFPPEIAHCVITPKSFKNN